MLVLAVLIVLMIAEIYRETHTFRTVTYKISSEKLKGIGSSGTVVFLSDLHNQEYGPGNQKLIERIKEIDPALVLIGGDMFVKGEQYSYEPAIHVVEEIAKCFPVYYVNGNHEQRRKENPENFMEQSYEAYQQRLQTVGVRFLENDSLDFTFEKCKVKITGFELPERCFSHFHKEPFSVEEVTERIGVPQKNVYQILLVHNPAYMKEYLAWGADLILSGHLHGGVVRIPGIAGLISPSFRLFPKYSGDHYKEENQDIVVSKGLGVHSVKVRLFNPAELVVLKLVEK